MLPTEITAANPTAAFEVASGQTATDGAIAALTATGTCRDAADAAAIKVAGVFTAVRSTTAEIREGVFRLANSATNAFTRASRGAVAFVEDSATVSSDGGTNSVVAGLVVDVDADGVWVDTRLAAVAAAQAIVDAAAAAA